MPRQPREFEIGNIYHIIKRGVDKRVIFAKPQDYSRFIIGLEFFNSHNSIDLWSLIAGGSDPAKHSGVRPSLVNRLEQKRKETPKPLTELLAFTLMTNHYHLIVREITKNGISAFMQKMGGYTSYFNKQYDRVGSLFQSRFKAIHIKSDNQLMSTFVYVHTNPIELKESQWKDLKVKDYQSAIKWLENYRWSSYLDYIGKQNFPTVTKRDYFSDLYGGINGCRQVVEDWIKFKAE